MPSSKLPAEARRQAIIEAAIRLFAQKGFRGVTTRELAQAVGVSEPVLYQHFKTKRDIYIAIVESKSTEVEQKFAPIREALFDFSHSDRTILREMAESISRWYEDDPSLNRLLLLSCLEGHEFSDIFFQRHASAQFDVLRRYFEQRIRRGIFRKLDAVTAAWSFIGMVAHHSMVRTLHHFDPHPQPRARVLDQMVDLFLAGVARGGK